MEFACQLVAFIPTVGVTNVSNANRIAYIAIVGTVAIFVRMGIFYWMGQETIYVWVIVEMWDSLSKIMSVLVNVTKAYLV